jgi:hypothetical protein
VRVLDRHECCPSVSRPIHRRANGAGQQPCGRFAGPAARCTVLAENDQKAAAPSDKLGQSTSALALGESYVVEDDERATGEICRRHLPDRLHRQTHGGCFAQLQHTPDVEALVRVRVGRLENENRQLLRRRECEVEGIVCL